MTFNTNRSLAMKMCKLFGSAITLSLASLVGCGSNKTVTAEAEGPMPTPAMVAPIQPLQPIQPISDSPVTVAPIVAPIVEAPAARPAPAASGNRSYTVQKGDTLTKIARTQYGDASAVRKIKAANPGMNADQIKTGQKINLP